MTERLSDLIAGTRPYAPPQRATRVPRPAAVPPPLPSSTVLTVFSDGEDLRYDLAPGAPIPARGDVLHLHTERAGPAPAYRVTERVFVYAPSPVGPAVCEVLLYTESC